MRIAVVGGGIAGIGAAWYLQGAHEVTLFEARERLGGHANPVVVADPRAGPVTLDTGFLVFNPLTYRRFFAFLEDLGVLDRVARTDMALSYSDFHKDLHFASPDLNGVFFQRRNLIRPRFYRLFADLLRFRRRGRADLRAGRLGRRTLGEYTSGYSALFRENLVIPVGAAIWSVGAGDVLSFPAASFLQFFDNHQMLDGIPEKHWRTFRGSSADYLERFAARFQGAVRAGCPVRRVTRGAGSVRLALSGGEADFDAAVLATHADTSLALLAEPTPEERRLLGAWRYHPNRVVLHTDASLLHPDRRLWRSWNVTIAPGGTAVTYWLNRVQNLDCARDYFVSLSPERVDPALTLGEYRYHHPIYELASMDTQDQLPSLNGARRTWFCGSYFGYGFHEDALASARAAADELIGIPL